MLIFRAPLPASGEFEIEYVHSYYNAPTTEHFVAEGDESFEVVEISSPSEAVLDYYELPGRKEKADGERMRIVPHEPRRFEELPLIGTEKGQRTLVVSGERFPLYAEDGPRHVSVQVEEPLLPFFTPYSRFATPHSFCFHTHGSILWSE